MKSEYSAWTVLVVFAAILVLSASSMAAKEKVIYRFKAGKDGANPYGSLIADAAGNLYGTTAAGGDATNCLSGCGTIFRLSPPAMAGLPWTETILYRFHAPLEQRGNNFRFQPMGCSPMAARRPSDCRSIV